MGAPDLLQHLLDAGFILAVADAGGIRIAPISKLSDAHRQAIRDHRAELLALLSGAPPPTTGPLSDSLAAAPAVNPDRWCWPHSNAMNGAELATFASRTQRFTWRGVTTDDAEALADRLVIRDRQQDERRVCLECSNHRPGRCGNYRAARLHSPELGRDLAELLQRCPGFQTVR